MKRMFVGLAVLSALVIASSAHGASAARIVRCHPASLYPDTLTLLCQLRRPNKLVVAIKPTVTVDLVAILTCPRHQPFTVAWELKAGQFFGFGFSRDKTLSVYRVMRRSASCTLEMNFRPVRKGAEMDLRWKVLLFSRPPPK